MAIGAYQEGDRDAAIGHFTAAIEQFGAAGMQLYAAVCRRRSARCSLARTDGLYS
jgi:hypothetical protein